MDFYTTIAKYYNSIFPLNYKQVDMIDTCIGQNKQITLLDIGCGTGQLANLLATKYSRVIAGDTNNSMLDIAKSEATSKNVSFLNFGMLDIANRFSIDEFDVVLCFGNTVVHLNDLSEIGMFFNHVYNVLKIGGKFIFQIINYDNIMDNGITSLPTIENDSIKFVRNYTVTDDNRIEFCTTLTVKQSKKIIENKVILFPLRKKQIETLLTSAGFSTINFFSSFNGDTYSSNSLPLVIECY